ASVGFASATSTTPTFSMSWTNSTDTNFSTHNTKICSDTGCSVDCISAGTSLSTPKTMTGVNTGIYYGCVQGEDTLGRTSAWIASSTTVTVDTSVPTVVSVSSAKANGSYKAGESIVIDVTFSENVYLTNSNNITLQLETGTTDQLATYSGGDTSSVLSFTYVVQAGDTTTDLDYKATTSLSLGAGGLIKDVASNNADLALPTAGSGSSLGGQKAIVIDTAAPSAPTITAPGTTSTSNVTIVSGAAETGSTVTVKDGSTTIGTVVASAGAYSLTLATPLSDGTYSLTAFATDVALNQSASSAAVALKVDTINPTAPSTVAFAGAYSTSLTFPMTWTNSTDTNFSTHNTKLCTDTGCSAGCISAGTSASTPRTMTGVNAGVYYGCVQGQDSLSRISAWIASSATITVDTSAPAAPVITAPALTTTANVTTISGTAEAGSTVTIKDGSTVLGTAVATGGNFSLTLSTPLSDGNYSLTAQAADLAGNVGTASAARALKVDTINPTAPASVAFAGAYSTSLTFPMTWTNSTDTNFSTHNTKICTDTGCSAGCISVDTSTSTPKTMTGVNAGVYYGCVQGLDTLGRTSAFIASSATITVDTSAPAAPVITAPALTTQSAVSVISGTAEAGSTVTIKDGSTVLGTAVATGGNFSLTLGTPLSDGDYALTAQAADPAGNVGTASSARSLKVDTINPSAPASVAFSGAYSTSLTFPMTWTNSTDTNFSTHNTKICTDAGCSAGCISIDTSASTPKTMTGVNAGIYRGCVQGLDSVGRTSAWIASAASITVDNAAPTVTSVTSAKADGRYKANETIVINVTFSENVYLTNPSNLSLQLETGTVDQLAVYSGGDTTNILSFTYTVQAGDDTSDLEYLATSSLSLGAGGLIKDVAGNTAVRTLPNLGSGTSLGGQKAIVIDTSAPSAPTITAPGTTSTSNVSVVSGAAETGSTVTIKNGATVIGTAVASAGAYSVTLAAPLSDGTYSLTALATDVAGNISASSSVVALKVDTINPSAPASVGFSAAYSTTPTFSMAWTNSTDTNFSTHNVKLCTDNLCTTSCVSAGTSLSTPKTMTGANGGSYYGCVQGVDTLGLTSAWIASVSKIDVDTSAPTVTSVSASTADGSYKAGTNIYVTVTFSEAVWMTNSTAISIQLSTGSTNRLAANPTGDGTATLTFTYQVQAGDVSSDLDYLGTNSLSLGANGLIKDLVGNNAVLTLQTPGAANSIAYQKAIIIDTSAPIAPTITAPGAYSTSNVSIVSGAAETGSTVTIKSGSTVIGTAVASAGAYSATLGSPLGNGDYVITAIATDVAGNVSAVSTTLNLRVHPAAPAVPTITAFTTPTKITTPVFSGTADANVTVKVYAGATLIITTTSDNSGAWSATSSALTHGTYSITATATDPAARVSAASAGASLNIDTVAPTVTSVTSSTADATYGYNQAINARVNFSEVVTVTGTPTLTLELGASDPAAAYTTGSTTNQLNFSFTTAYGQASSDLDYVSTTSLALAGGTITDAAGNSAVLTLPSPGAANSIGANKAIVIDAVKPVITNVTSTTADGNYAATNVIDVTVTFNKVVTVAGGTPTLTLALSPSNRTVNLSSGSGSTDLHFSYTVTNPDVSTDLNYSSTTALALAGATIKDARSNDADLTLPVTGAGNSLAGNKAIVIKGTNVSPSISTATTTQNAYSNSSITPINFNQTSSGTDFDVDNDAITYSCLYDTTINSTLDGGGTACTSLPNVSVSFNTATGTLSWTPSDAATNNVTSIKDYEIIVTGSDNNNTTPSRAYAGVKVIRPFTSTIGYDAGASANYTFDSTKIDFSGGYARLGEIDQKDDDNTSTGFSAAAQVGTVWDSSYIRLGSSGGCDASLYNCATLDATWVPSYTSLINYYTMEGNRNDVKGSNNMTAGSGGAPTVAATGKINGGSLTFDGVAQSALTTRTIQDDFTISLWMKTNMTEGSNCWEFYSGYGVVNMELSGFQNDFGMSICGGKIIVGTNKDASNDLSRSSSFVADDTWHFVVFTREKATGTIKIYVDGRLDGTGTGASAASLTGSATITVGNMNVGSAYYRGSIDELAYWSTVLDANEIQTIYDRQSARFAGSFTSRIVDTGVTGNPWSTLGWTTTQPFFKELTDYASGALQNETTSEYSGLPTNSLMTGLLGLWHLNESSAGTVTGPKDFKDDSGANNHGVYVTQGTFGSPGRFGNSANVSGANGYVKVNADLMNRIPLTISAWFRPEDLRYAPSVVSNDSDGAFGAGFGIRANGTLIIDQHNSFSGDVGTAIKPNEWHHVVVVYESATKIRAYQNGKEVYNATIADYSGSLNGSAHVLFGAHNTTSLYPFKGSIDEVGIWGRSMTAAEALSLYRRSANRIRYQIRSCSVADCSDAVFKGPTNNLKSTFSELFNNTTPIGMAGDVQKGAASLAFSAFSGSGLSVSSNRYFQYRAFLESDDTQNLCTYGTAKPCSPELKDVLIGPAHYNTTVPTIASTSAVSFYNINTFTESLGSGGCGGTAKYNLSVNGTNWFYWTGTAWGAANGTYAQANTAAQINSNAAAFGAAVGRTNLYVKAFLNSNGQQACELDALSIGGNATH
ncbi:MAG: LamG domain-containing protein, partial [Proteobacteria bacterium]